MKLNTILVTSSSGLIGSEAVEHFDRQGHRVHGIDNNMRAVFFGEQGDTTWNRYRLLKITKNFTHHDLDIRDRTRLDTLFRSIPFDLIVHCAAQPSHDKARDIPILDFEVNALGTLHLLEAARLHARMRSSFSSVPTRFTAMLPTSSPSRSSTPVGSTRAPRTTTASVKTVVLTGPFIRSSVHQRLPRT